MAHPARITLRQGTPVSSEHESQTRLAPALQTQFLEQLALHTDGIGLVQALESLRRRGVLDALAHAPRGGVRLGELARAHGANLGYLAVVLRVLSAQGWLWRGLDASAERTLVGPTPWGSELLSLLEENGACAELTAFLPVASNMASYLSGVFDPAADVPSLDALSRRSGAHWGLPVLPGERRREAALRLEAALNGNLLGPVALALFHGANVRAEAPSAYLGARDVRRFAPEGERLRAAFDVLATAGWAEWVGQSAVLTELGTHASRRALAFGVPVSYLPLFGRVDELLFGDAEALWRRQPGEPERLVDRALNVRASGASHHRYFAAADEVIARAFDLPWRRQPLGFCDMGCGDGAWLEHVSELILTRTERGRLIRAFPDDLRYRLLLVGVDYNEAARSATRERLTRASIPHLVLFGDINDPAGLYAELARHGIDSRDLLHGNSFLIHNRPYAGVRDAGAAARRSSALDGAYAWRGRPIAGAELEQNLVEFFGAWGDVLGEHGMVSIELHDPESFIIGKTLTSYVLTHGLSDQLTVGLDVFLRAAAEAGWAVDLEHHRYYPEPRSAATVSISHFQRGARRG